MGGLKHRKSISKPPTSLDDFGLSSIVKSDQNALVCVQLQILNSSVPVPNSTVAIPSLEDTSRLGQCRDVAGPLEPLHKGAKAQLAEQSALRNLSAREILGFFRRVIIFFPADVGLVSHSVFFRVLLSCCLQVSLENLLCWYEALPLSSTDLLI